MLFVRLILAAIIGGAGALGAQYGLSMVMGEPAPSQAEPAEAVDEIAEDILEAGDDAVEALEDAVEPDAEPASSETSGADDGSEAAMEERVHDDRLPLPYEEGEAAAFLADALGSEAFWINGHDSRVQPGVLAGQIAEPDSGGEAVCEPSHVMITCTLRRADGWGYSFNLESAEDGWTVETDSVRMLSDS